jgi:hypothetical protein
MEQRFTFDKTAALYDAARPDHPRRCSALSPASRIWRAMTPYSKSAAAPDERRRGSRVSAPPSSRSIPTRRCSKWQPEFRRAFEHNVELTEQIAFSDRTD